MEKSRHNINSAYKEMLKKENMEIVSRDLIKENEAPAGEPTGAMSSSPNLDMDNPVFSIYGLWDPEDREERKYFHTKEEFEQFKKDHPEWEEITEEEIEEELKKESLTIDEEREVHVLNNSLAKKFFYKHENTVKEIFNQSGREDISVYPKDLDGFIEDLLKIRKKVKVLKLK
jgi:hypothetical protein